MRDISDGKGRMDLMPLGQLADYLEFEARNTVEWLDNERAEATARILRHLDAFIYDGDRTEIFGAITVFHLALRQEPQDSDLPATVLLTGVLAASRQMEDGARKYSDRNWERGMPLHCYVDSGTRHLIKWLDGLTDEPHDRAFLWNMWALLRSTQAHPHLNDLPHAQETP